MSDDGATELLPPHISADFYLWLWYRSEERQGTFTLDDGTPVTVFVDDRIALRETGGDKPTAVLTGDSPGTTPEARAAVVGGKVPKELRLLARREDREYHFSVRGTRVSVAQAKLPTQVKTGDVAEMLYDRMFCYEELHWIVACLLRTFARERVGEGWRSATLPEMRAWIGALDAAGARG